MAQRRSARVVTLPVEISSAGSRQTEKETWPRTAAAEIDEQVRDSINLNYNALFSLAE
jgi:hypothetical protein